MTEPSVRPYGDPWPAPTITWGDPPWVMSGTSVTAWFETDVRRVRELVSPAFEPALGPAGGVRTRARFYTVDYSPRDGSDHWRAQTSGRFLEAVIAFTGVIADVPGEYSAYMWTDDDRYRSWGREVFGWPLVPAQFELTGDVWGDAVTRGSMCRVVDPDVTISLELDDTPAEDIERGPAANWLTPRRVVFPGRPDRRDLLVVRPEVRAAGRFARRHGRLTLQPAPGSWAQGLEPLGDLDIHTLQNFQIVVGGDVETVIEGDAE